MTYAVNVGTTALTLLRQAGPVSSVVSEESSPSSDLIMVVNGKASSVSQPAGSQAQIAESLFSLTATDVTKMKLDLIERTGKALGVHSEDYISKDDFVTAMREAVAKIKMQPEGDKALLAIEKDLGLDKLGVSITDVIDSAGGGAGGEKVSRALEKQVTDDERPGTSIPSNMLTVAVDDIGRYGIPGVKAL